MLLLKRASRYNNMNNIQDASLGKNKKQIGDYTFNMIPVGKYKNKYVLYNCA